MSESCQRCVFPAPEDGLDLPDGVGPCGENGEFQHTFMTAGPILVRPTACRRGDVVERDGFVFCDLLDDRS